MEDTNRKNRPTERESNSGGKKILYLIIQIIWRASFKYAGNNRISDETLLQVSVKSTNLKSNNSIIISVYILSSGWLDALLHTNDRPKSREISHCGGESVGLVCNNSAASSDLAAYNFALFFSFLPIHYRRSFSSVQSDLKFPYFYEVLWREAWRLAHNHVIVRFLSSCNVTVLPIVYNN